MSPARRNFGLDVLRASAVSFVVLTHAYSFFLPWFDFRWLYGFGTLGVDLFFALSGFLIGRILLAPAFAEAGWPGLLNFWSRRWLRTLPAYYACLLALALLHRGAGFHWSQLLFLQNSYAGALSLFPVSWSLTIEEWFYLTFPLVILALGRARAGWAIALYICAPPLLRLAGHSIGVTDWAYGARTNLPMRMDAIAFGVLAAWLYLHRPELVRRAQSSRLVWVVALSGLAGTFLWVSLVSAEAGAPLSLPAQVLMFSLSAAFCAAMVLLFERFRACGSGWAPRAVTGLSLISYSVYLVHFEVFSSFVLYRPGRSPGEAALNCAAAVVAMLAASTLLYVAVERPFMALRDRRRAQTARVAA